MFKDNEELFFKYKDNLVGGPSIVFHHYQEKDVTRIRGEKLCKRVVGYDANSLYLYALANSMFCGDHTIVKPYDGILNDVLNDRFFGLIECDIETPEHLKSYFAEMPPIFKNVEVTYNDLSEETKL